MNAEERVDRLLDAIELVKDNRRAEAQNMLRELIRDNGDSEQAWLWMSVAVDNLDQSIICLDNVLRINPKNQLAADLLFRLHTSQRQMAQRRRYIRAQGSWLALLLWLLTLGISLVALAGGPA
jgi:tetratricopeptide (TPR) repeat protein